MTGCAVRYLSQTKAAKLAGVSRGTIANRIEEGVLSVAPDGIDPAELARVFPEIDGALVDHFLSTGEVSKDDRPATPPTPANSPANDRSSPTAAIADGAPVVAADAAWLRGLVDEQRVVIERKDRELRDAAGRLHEAEERAERREAAWLKQLDALTTKLLPAPEPEPEPPRGFLRRVFGG